MLKRSALIAATGCLGLIAVAPAQAAGTFEVDTTADTVDANPGNGRCADAQRDCSLRAAVQEANASGGATIELDDRTYRLAIAGAGEDAAATGDLDVTSRITIEGDDARVDAGGIDRVFDIREGGSLKIEELTVEGGSITTTALPPDGGGGLRSVGTLVIEESRILDNVTQGPGASGGGILASSGRLLIEESILAGNAATRAGGGIEVGTATTVIDESTLRDNETGPGPGNGGGVHVTGAARTIIEDSVVRDNTAALEGGGLWNSGTGTMAVSDTRVTGNDANGDMAENRNGGGGLFNEVGGTLIVDDSRITGNTADGGALTSGGGILNDRGTLRVSDTEIRNNQANRAGGGIETDAGTVRLDDVTLANNRTGPSPGNGGGFHTTGPGDVRIDDSTVTGNSAANEGGGLWNSSVGTMIVTDTRVRGNSAPIGPNVFNQPPGGTFTIDGEPVPPGDNDIVVR